MDNPSSELPQATPDTPAPEPIPTHQSTIPIHPTQPEHPDKKNLLMRASIGFVILVILVVAIVGLTSYLKKHKTAPTKTVTTTSSWKNYCDNTAKFCFKYLATWKATISSSSTTGTFMTVINPTATTNVQYGDYPISQGYPPSFDTTNPDALSAPNPKVVVKIAGSFSFYTVSISNLADNSSLYKVVGGYVVNGTDNIPFYFVAKTSDISSESLVVGKVTQLQSSGAISITDQQLPNSIVIMSLRPITPNTFTPSQATAWFNSSDGKASLQLMQSFYSE